MDFSPKLRFEGRVNYRTKRGYVVWGSGIANSCRLSEFSVSYFCYESSVHLMTVKLSKTFLIVSEDGSIHSDKEQAPFGKCELVSFQFKYCLLNNNVLDVSCSIRPGRYFNELYLSTDFELTLTLGLKSNNNMKYH